MKTIPTLIGAVFVLAHASAWATTPVPSPQTSTVDPCLTACPGGDFIFNVIVRASDGTTIAGSVVTIAYSGCPAFHVCPSNGTESYISDPPSQTVRAVANGFGLATLPLRAGGSCGAGTVIVSADGFQLATRALASPDQNGDGFVDGQDYGLLQAKVGGVDPTGDLNCDAAVTNADLALLQQHADHACSGPTPVRPGTWGRIKTIYR